MVFFEYIQGQTALHTLQGLVKFSALSIKLCIELLHLALSSPSNLEYTIQNSAKMTLLHTEYIFIIFYFKIPKLSNPQSIYLKLKYVEKEITYSIVAHTMGIVREYQNNL